MLYVIRSTCNPRFFLGSERRATYGLDHARKFSTYADAEFARIDLPHDGPESTEIVLLTNANQWEAGMRPAREFEQERSETR